jgi:hypothetical protein
MASRRKEDQIRMTRKILGRLLGEATEVRERKIRGPFWKRIFFGCVEDRIEIARESIRRFWGGIDRRKYSVVRSEA